MIILTVLAVQKLCDTKILVDYLCCTVQNNITIYPIKILNFDFEEDAKSLTFDVLFSDNCRAPF